MKKLIIFFPPILFMCLIIVLGACENNPEKPELKKDIPTDSASLKDNYQEVNPLDSLNTVPSMDSVISDTLNIVHDTISFDNETHVIPVPKPTFKVFSKYMKLHSKGPIV